MSNTTPYDHITPPPSPPANIQSQTPRPHPKVESLRAVADPHDASRPAAYSHAPRPVPREGRSVARDSPYYPITKSATIPGSTMSASSSRYSTITAKARNNYYAKRQQPNTNRTQRRKAGVRRAKQTRDYLRGMTPLTPVTTLDSPEPATMSTAELAAKSKDTPAGKATARAANVRRKRRPTEIFNMSFSFGSISKRRPSDHTPQISPRTSVSSRSGSSPPTPISEDSMMKQRADSSDYRTPNIHEIQICSPTHNQDGYNMGSVPTGFANVWVMDTNASFKNLPIATFTEAHPGQPVDFRSPSLPKSTNNFSCDLVSDARQRVDSQVYHGCLAKAARRNSSPHENRLSRGREEYFKTSAKEERLNKEARILGLDTNCASGKRACTLEQTNRSTRKMPPPSFSIGSSSSSSMTSRFSSRTSSSMSDPSMEAFLTHVRASQEARALKAAMMRHGKGTGCGDDAVFTDEDEKGFLSDEPL